MVHGRSGWRGLGAPGHFLCLRLLSVATEQKQRRVFPSRGDFGSEETLQALLRRVSIPRGGQQGGPGCPMLSAREVAGTPASPAPPRRPPRFSFLCAVRMPRAGFVVGHGRLHSIPGKPRLCSGGGARGGAAFSLHTHRRPGHPRATRRARAHTPSSACSHQDQASKMGGRPRREQPAAPPTMEPPLEAAAEAPGAPTTVCRAQAGAPPRPGGLLTRAGRLRFPCSFSGAVPEIPETGGPAQL